MYDLDDNLDHTIDMHFEENQTVAKQIYMLSILADHSHSIMSWSSLYWLTEYLTIFV